MLGAFGRLAEIEVLVVIIVGNDTLDILGFSRVGRGHAVDKEGNPLVSIVISGRDTGEVEGLDVGRRQKDECAPKGTKVSQHVVCVSELKLEVMLEEDLLLSIQRQMAFSIKADNLVKPRILHDRSECM